ncbi:large ribosomal subunit protein uL23m isoform X1 [Bos indicus]|uniref:Large ribosomal subunit protein uL23m n=1 Tax=Bos indicus TaxID=9915 RepID=A0ABM4RT65_BOSIN
MGAEGHAVCLGGQGRRGWALSGRGDSTATALAILSGRCLRGGGGVGAVDRVAAVERVTPGSQRALADRPSPPLVSLPPGRATGLSPGGWSPVTPTSLHPDASAGMTRVDLRNYLERVYNVPVAAVRTRVQHGSNRRRDHRNVRIKQPDYKVAYVQLAHGQTFTFPDLFPKGKRPGGSSADEDLRDQVLEEQQQRQSPDPRRGGVPSWFGL